MISCALNWLGISERPHGPLHVQAQENPDFDEQPDRAPEGILLPEEAIRKLPAEIVFFTFLLPHALQVTSFTALLELTRASNCFLQSLQRNSYKGMLLFLLLLFLSINI